MATRKQYDFITEVVIEGLPGAGKTSAIVALAEHYAQWYTDTLVFVNGKPHKYRQDERAVSNFLEMRYDPDIRQRRILTTSCIGVRMAADRLEAYECMRQEHEKTGKKVLNLMERDDFTAIRLFLPATFVHLQPTSIEWIDFRGMIDEFDEVAKAVHAVTEPRLVIVVYLDVDAELAFERVRKRNRPTELRGFEAWFMHYLKRAHDIYLGLAVGGGGGGGKNDNMLMPAGRRLSVVDANKYDSNNVGLVNRVVEEIDKQMTQ